jgi:uncharacterized protein (TIRG00374 family)
MLIKPLGHNPSNSNAFHAVMIGYLANLAIPRIGEVTRCTILNRTNQIPLNRLIGTVIVERIIDVLFLLIILLLSVFIEYSTIIDFVQVNVLGGFSEKLKNAQSLGLFALLGLAIGIIAFYIIRKRHERLLENNIYKKIFSIIEGFKEGLISIFNLENKFLFIIYSCAIWLLYILSTYLCFFAISPTAELSFASSIFIMAMGGIGMSVPVQGGIGAYEATIQLALLVYGIQSEDGLSYATLNHSAQILSIVVVGSLSLFYIFISYKKVKNAE